MKRLYFLLALMASVLMANAQKIEQTYHFGNPTLETKDGYQQLSLKGCAALGKAGEPSLPWQNVSLMLPEHQEAASMQVEYYDFVELEGAYTLFPYQRPRPYSQTEALPFDKDEALYRSTDTYPAVSHSGVSTQYLNGVGFAFGGFTPVRYVPSTGKVCYARTVKVTVECQRSRDDHSSKLWLTPENEATMLRLAQNASQLGTYASRGRSLNHYDMLLITSEEWIAPLAEYVQMHNERGVRTRAIALEDIYAMMEGRDEQEKIRNYVIQEYENNGISMVSLGGDVSIVPFRSLWCYAQPGYEDQLPADMYYVCLDGTLNDDNDDRWGEVGEDDLLPELGIARLPFNNEKQFETIMGKTFSYTLNPVLGEFSSPILGGEHLGDGYYGSSEVERIIGVSHDFDYTTSGYDPSLNFKKYYATATHTWNGGEFRDVIRSGGQYVHHAGHANTDYVAGWTGSMMPDNYFEGNDGINHNYMIFHTHGCICGDFSHSCILEKLMTISTGFVATTGNSRYGWYSPWGDGMAAHIHREFVDAYCNDHIQFLSMALREAKIATAPFAIMDEENGSGCFRWNLYCLNELGDAALSPWFEEPFVPNVTYSNGLIVGTESTTINVMHNTTPLVNFRVSLYHGDDLVGFGLTDENGDATLLFDEPIANLGDMKLIVSGQSAWPQTLDVTEFDGSSAFVYADFMDLSSDPSAEDEILLGITLHNISNVNAGHVEATLSTECEYITITNGTFSQDDLEGMSDHDFEGAFTFTVADDVPDHTIATFTIASNDGNGIHYTHKNFLIIAPEMSFSEFTADDSHGDANGLIDAGEEIILHVTGINLGHAGATGITITASCDDNRIQLGETTFSIEQVAAGEEFSIDVPFTSDEDITGGTAFSIVFAMQNGGYSLTYDFHFSVGHAIENFETGDFNFMQWEFGGDTPWTITDEESHNGQFCARSGAIDNDQISSLMLYANTSIEGELSFYFKTSTASHDYLVLLIDDKIIKYWDKENDWTLFSTPLQAGSHVIEFRYDKSPSVTGGQDCVWIDDVIFPATFVVTDVEETISEKTNLLYPNPNNGSFTISLADDDADISVYNAMGQRLMTRHHASGYQQIDLSHAAAGVYFVKIQSADNVTTERVIIK